MVIPLIRTAVIGVGRWGKNIVRVLSELRHEGIVDLIAICDIDYEKALEIAKQYGVPKVFSSIHELVNNVRIDAVLIATPIDTLYRISKLCLENEVHTFIEKPVAEHPDQVLELKCLAEKHGVHVQTGFIMRFNPVVEKIKEIIFKEKVLYLVFRRLSRRPEHVRKYSILLDLTVHDVDLCLHLAKCNTYRVKWAFIERKGIDDVVLALIDTDKASCLVHTDGLSLSKVRELEVIAENIFVRGNTDNLSLTIKYPDGRIVTETLVWVEPLKKELRAFIDCIDKGLCRDVPTLDDAYHVLKIIEDIKRISSIR